MFRVIKLFSDRAHYRREFRGQLADILRPYWKDASFNEAQRRQMYGLTTGDFCLVEDLAQADLAVLPLTWNHYLARRELFRAQEFIHAARQAGRPVLSYVSGDEGVTVPPDFDDVHVVRAGGFRSRHRQRQVTQPVFFDDPLKTYPEFRGGERQTEDRGQRTEVHGSNSQLSTLNSQLPKIGFCGQASVNALKLGRDVVRGGGRNLGYHLGLRLAEPQPVYPPALLRARAMRKLAGSPLVQTQFIARARYRAGATDATRRAQTTQEFYQNIAETDYTLCVRGGGNFSKRFYETLAMGRIPVLIDTDCLLPFEPGLAWDGFVVRVPANDLASLPRRVADHFAAVGTAGLAEQKKKCRQLWNDWLSFGNFHRRLADHILETR